jgi:hypothetical protein
VKELYNEIINTDEKNYRGDTRNGKIPCIDG